MDVSGATLVEKGTIRGVRMNLGYLGFGEEISYCYLRIAFLSIIEYRYK